MTTKEIDDSYEALYKGRLETATYYIARIIEV